MDDVTHLLNLVEAGDPRAAARLLPLVYDELRALAARQLAAEKPGQTLDATGLVHEAYLRLAPARDGVAPQKFANRRHFYAAAAEAMRRILVENARRKGRIKHGGGMQREEFDPAAAIAPRADAELIELDQALTRFAQTYPQHAKLVELRYFAGLTGDNAAKVLGISPATADRHWAFARAWLRRELTS